MQQLRSIARVVGLAVAMPLVSLGHWPDPLKNTLITQLFPHSALALFISAFVIWSGLFYWMHMKMVVDRRNYILCGIALGLLPTVFYSIVCVVAEKPNPPLAVAIVGLITGFLAGLILHRELVPQKNNK